MTQPLNDQRYAAVCNTADQPAIHAALAAVSGSYEDMFSIPCFYDDDPDPVWTGTDWDYSGTTIRRYSTGIVLTNRHERRNIQSAVQPWLTSADWKEVDSRGPRFPDEHDLFLSNYQLRINGAFVAATGLFRAHGGLPAQTLSLSAQLLDQWENLEERRNTQLDGTGQRIQVDFSGKYEVQASINWDESLAPTANLFFQLNMDGAPVGPVIQRLGAQVQGVTGTLKVDFPTNTSKLGVGVWSDVDGTEFKIENAWLGVKRIGRL